MEDEVGDFLKQLAAKLELVLLTGLVFFFTYPLILGRK